MAAKIRLQYFSDQDIDAATIYEYSQLISDVGFSYGIDWAAKAQAIASTGKTYYYRFSVNGLYNLAKMTTVANDLQLDGATHHDDFFYLFGYMQ